MNQNYIKYCKPWRERNKEKYNKQQLLYSTNYYYKNKESVLAYKKNYYAYKKEVKRLSNILLDDIIH
jgi:hypothetical protein